MAKCKRCNTENKNKNRAFICEKCKSCEVCGGYKGSLKAKKCKSCQSKDKEYRKKLSESCKGTSSWAKGLTKKTHASLKSMSNKKKNKSPWNKGLTKSDDDRIAKLAEAKIGTQLTNEIKEKISKSNKGNSYPITDEVKQKIRKKLIERINSGEINGAPKCSIYEYNGYKVQGKSELRWIKQYYNSIIKDSKKGIKTPFGLYFPDFETKDFYVEVKSRYTYNLMLNKPQFEKIKFVSSNYKPVRLFIDDGNKWDIIDTSVEWS
jgi:hypothetical protein